MPTSDAYRARFPADDGPAGDAELRSRIEVLEAQLRTAQDERDDARRMLRDISAEHRALIEGMTVGFCVLEMIHDDAGRAVDYRFIDANRAFEEQTGLRDAIGRTARELVPDLEDHWVALYGAVAETGEARQFVQESPAMNRWFDVHAHRIGSPDQRRVALLFTDITARRRAEQEAETARSRLQTTIDSITDGLLVLDRGWRITYVSETAARMIGMSREQMVGGALWKVFPQGVGTRFQAEYERAVATGEPAHFEAFYPEPLNLWLECHAYPSAEGLSVYFRDVSERKRDEVALLEAKRMAEEASQAKSQFLAVMSHELRTPLAGVIGYADLLESGVLGPATDRQREALSRIKSSSWHLVGIIDDILTLSRAEAGKEEVRWDDVDVAQITREVADIIEPQAVAAGLALDVTGVEKPVFVHTDGGKVRQILVNLAGNAARYTERGSVSVRLDTGDDEWLRIAVHDTGPGIAAADRERVFQAFTQVDSSPTRSGSGTGLGLAICRRLARLLGGDVELESEVGIGSTFTLRLPHRRADDAAR